MYSCFLTRGGPQRRYNRVDDSRVAPAVPAMAEQQPLALASRQESDKKPWKIRLVRVEFDERAAVSGGRSQQLLFLSSAKSVMLRW